MLTRCGWSGRCCWPRCSTPPPPAPIKPERERLDAAIVLDEAHQFLHLPVGVEDTLATARAWHVSMVLAHQHLGQLSPTMVEAIDANARNKIMFKLAPHDARILAHHVEPYLHAADLTYRPAFGVVCRLVIHGQDADAFTLDTQPAPRPVPGRAEALRAAARARRLSIEQRRVIAQARQLGAGPTPEQPDTAAGQGLSSSGRTQSIPAVTSVHSGR